MSETTTVERPSTRPALTSAQMIQKYRALRDKKKEIEDQHKAQLAPYTAAMEKLAGFLLDDLNQSGGDSLKTPEGTAYKSTRTSATVTHWSETLAWIKAREAWELLEARVSKTAVVAIFEELANEAQARAEAGETVAPEDMVIPGVKVTQDIVLNVRAS